MLSGVFRGGKMVRISLASETNPVTPRPLQARSRKTIRGSVDSFFTCNDSFRIRWQVSARGYVMNWAVVAGVQISASKVALGHICVGWSCFGAAALQPRVQLD